MKLVQTKKPQHRFTFSKTGGYHGKLTMKHNLLTDEIHCSSILINLMGMKHHKNNGREVFPMDEDDLIEAIYYTINHEFLHLAMYIADEHDGLTQENYIYRMIGNGHNEYFNEAYNIPIDEEVERLTKDE